MGSGGGESERNGEASGAGSKGPAVGRGGGAAPLRSPRAEARENEEARGEPRPRGGSGRVGLFRFSFRCRRPGPRPEAEGEVQNAVIVQFKGKGKSSPGSFYLSCSVDGTQLSCCCTAILSLFGEDVGAEERPGMPRVALKFRRHDVKRQVFGHQRPSRLAFTAVSTFPSTRIISPALAAAYSDGDDSS
nr:uncharacterized protein LOC106825876 [Equus asinus]